ncbi:hypothetical protein ACHAWX_000843 [Stephanocyclus meneghinianus]
MDFESSDVNSHLGILTDNPTTENEMLSLSCIAKQVLILDDELLAVQTGFNRQLLNAVQLKLSTRDNVVLRLRRIEEIDELLKGDLGCNNEDVSLSTGEFNSNHMTMTDLRNLFFRGSINDFGFLLNGNVDLSPAAEALDGGGTLKQEKDQLSREIRTLVDDFDKSMYNLRRMQLEVTLKLRLGEMKLNLKAQQMDVLIDHGSTIEHKRNKLRAIQCVMPIQKLNIQIDKVTDANRPVLVPKKTLEDLNCKSVDLERMLGDIKYQASNLQRQNKKLNTSIRQLKTELVQHQNTCQELQVQKLGKPVDSSILDISPAQSDRSHELNTVQNQLESHHQHNLKTANKERNRLKNILVSVTSENTKFLRELASLKEQEMNINEDTRHATSSDNSDKSLLNNVMKDQERFRVLLGQQKDEIEQLRHEIRSLKTKCGHVAMNARLNHL